MSHISKTVTDTTMGSIKVECETTPRLSVGTMTFDLGWLWTVLRVQYCSLWCHEDLHNDRGVEPSVDRRTCPYFLKWRGRPVFYFRTFSGEWGVNIFCTNAHGIHWTIGTIFVKFSQLIFVKIIKTVATRCQVLRLKCTKFNFGWGSAPDPAGWAYSASPDP